MYLAFTSAVTGIQHCTYLLEIIGARSPRTQCSSHHFSLCAPNDSPTSHPSHTPISPTQEQRRRLGTLLSSESPWETPAGGIQRSWNDSSSILPLLYLRSPSTTFLNRHSLSRSFSTAIGIDLYTRTCLAPNRKIQTAAHTRPLTYRPRFTVLCISPPRQQRKYCK